MNISLKISDKTTQETISLGELCSLLGINEAELQGLSLQIEKNGAVLKSVVSLDEEYPGFAIDGETKDNIYYLAGAELPNTDYPLAYTTRLYAGCQDRETDCPIAMVLSNICDEPASAEGCKKALRCVYIDEEFAVGKPWFGISSYSYINGCSAEHQLPIQYDKDWNVLGIENDKFLYSLDNAGSAFKFWTVCEANGGYVAKQGVIDFNKVSDEDIQKALNKAGYKDLDMFVQETSPVAIPVKEDGSLDRESDDYCVDYMGLASLLIDIVGEEYLIPGYHWKDKESALSFFCDIFNVRSRIPQKQTKP